MHRLGPEHAGGRPPVDSEDAYEQVEYVEEVVYEEVEEEEVTDEEGEGAVPAAEQQGGRAPASPPQQQGQRQGGAGRPALPTSQPLPADADEREADQRPSSAAAGGPAAAGTPAAAGGAPSPDDPEWKQLEERAQLVAEEVKVASKKLATGLISAMSNVSEAGSSITKFAGGEFAAAARTHARTHARAACARPATGAFRRAQRAAPLPLRPPCSRSPPPPLTPCTPPCTPPPAAAQVTSPAGGPRWTSSPARPRTAAPPRWSRPATPAPTWSRTLGWRPTRALWRTSGASWRRWVGARWPSGGGSLALARPRLRPDPGCC
jgi:hypothetical protein